MVDDGRVIDESSYTAYGWTIRSSARRKSSPTPSVSLKVQHTASRYISNDTIPH